MLTCANSSSAAASARSSRISWCSPLRTISRRWASRCINPSDRSRKSQERLKATPGMCGNPFTLPETSPNLASPVCTIPDTFLPACCA